MAKFNIGDRITSVSGYNGFDDAVVIGVTDKEYFLKITNGTATIRISMEDNYRIKKSSKRVVVKEV